MIDADWLPQMTGDRARLSLEQICRLEDGKRKKGTQQENGKEQTRKRGKRYRKLRQRREERQPVEEKGRKVAEERASDRMTEREGG